jgi:DNA-binding NarL/FixJ family response regulator
MPISAGDDRAPAIRVLIADDEPIMRDVARMACEEHGATLVAEVATGESAVLCTLEFRPDILVLDLDLPDVDGFEVSRRLRAAGCDVRILGTTGEGGPVAVLGALRNGMAGLLDKMGVVTSLPNALAALAASRGAFTAEQQEVALDELASLLRSRQERSKIRASLSVREREVLALISQGLSTKQMATRLGISPRTVESHISRAYRKLAVRTRVQAVTRAAQAGIADLRPRSRRENDELAATRAG